MQPTTLEPTVLTGNILIGLLTPEQLAQQLGVTTRTLSRWEVQRIGPPRVVIGRQIFYRIASVDAWLVSREQRRARAR
jgi:predicted DNA-binding transcriptional regulator AlpA